uniref:Uncharacterized protein n=1 Tax=viral metagenome TaxID=1070528 RepID=A0A6M3M7X3_9ZZZZ
MMPHEEGEEREVKFIFETDVTVGDFKVTSLDVWAQYGGDRVNKVPEGANFEIHADYVVENLNPSTFTPIWSSSMTVYDETGGERVDSDNYGYHTGGGAKNAHDAINAVMPNRNTTYRVKIMCNQKTNAGTPPSSLW